VTFWPEFAGPAPAAQVFDPTVQVNAWLLHDAGAVTVTPPPASPPPPQPAMSVIKKAQKRSF
jgi:hypothetical protein